MSGIDSDRPSAGPPSAGPPDRLAGPLALDPQDWPARERYLLLTALVVPRPIAWVSTLDPTGVRNLAPHSYFTLVTHDPPHLAFSSTSVKDTLTNIRTTGEFVVNVVSADLVEQMNLTATDFPPDEDEFTWAGLTEAPSVRVAPPRVAQARAQLECRLAQEVPIGSATLVIGEVVHIHVDAGVWRGGRVDPTLLDPLCRLAGSGYALLGETFARPRQRWDEIGGSRT